MMKLARGYIVAVLDYVVDKPAEGKLASQQGPLDIRLVESSKHILALKEKCRDAVRIGFKLETGIKQRNWLGEPWPT